MLLAKISNNPLNRPPGRGAGTPLRDPNTAVPGIVLRRFRSSAASRGAANFCLGVWLRLLWEVGPLQQDGEVFGEGSLSICGYTVFMPGREMPIYIDLNPLNAEPQRPFLRSA